MAKQAFDPLQFSSRVQSLDYYLQFLKQTNNKNKNRECACSNDQQLKSSTPHLLLKCNRLLIFADTIFTILETPKRPWRHLAFCHLHNCWGWDVERQGAETDKQWVSPAECPRLHSSSPLGCFPGWPVLHRHSVGESFTIQVFASFGSQEDIKGQLCNNFGQSIICLQQILGTLLIQFRTFKAKGPHAVIKMARITAYLTTDTAGSMWSDPDLSHSPLRRAHPQEGLFHFQDDLNIGIWWWSWVLIMNSYEYADLHPPWYQEYREEQWLLPGDNYIR